MANDVTGSARRVDVCCARLVVAGLFLLTGGFFFFPDYGGVARVYYLLILLPTLIVFPIWCRRVFVHWQHWLLFLLPLVYLALSTSWGVGEDNVSGRSVWYWCKPVLFIGLLLMAMLAVLPQRDDLVRKLLQYLTIVAMITGVLALCLHIPTAIESGDWPRMAGISLRGDINVTAALYGINCLFCVWGILNWERSWRPVVFVSLLVSLVLVLLSRSKVPLAFVGAGFVWLLWEARNNVSIRTLLLWVLPVGLGMIGAYFMYFERIPFMDRPEGYSIRLDLWSQVLQQMTSHWWKGHGIGAELGFVGEGSPYESHSHNFVLDTLRYGGLLGAGLLLWQLAFFGYRGVRLYRRRPDLLPVVIWWAAGIVFLLTNGQQPLVKPHHIWFFYWIPLTLLIASDRMGESES